MSIVLGSNWHGFFSHNKLNLLVDSIKATIGTSSLGMNQGQFRVRKYGLHLVEMPRNLNLR